MNGRVADSQGYSTPYSYFEETKRSSNSVNDTLRGIQQPSQLSSLFFSSVNIDALQQAIRYSVYKQSKAVISRQSDVELEVVMRSIFLQYSLNEPNDIVGQVRVLNQKVLDYCVPLVLREMQQYATYRNDISRLPVPMERQQNVSSAGSKFLVRKDF